MITGHSRLIRETIASNTRIHTKLREQSREEGQKTRDAECGKDMGFVQRKYV